MKLRISIAITILLLLAAGCSEKTLDTMKVGTWKTAQTIQPFYYNEYIEEPYDVDVLPFTNPGDQKTALLSGELDMCGTTLVTAIVAASKEEPIQIVCNLTNKCSALVVGTDSDIQDIADLKGKTIAYVPGTMHHVLLLETLEKAGLQPDQDVTLTRVNFFDMGQALAKKSIDAFCSGEPFPSVAVTEGYGRVLTYPYYDDSIGTINGVMITTKERLQENPEGIHAIVKAHMDATEYLTANQDSWLQKASEFGTDPESLELALDNMDIAWDISPDMIEQTEKLANRMLGLGVIEAVPDIEAMFALEFINEMNQ